MAKRDLGFDHKDIGKDETWIAFVHIIIKLDGEERLRIRS